MVRRECYWRGLVVYHQQIQTEEGGELGAEFGGAEIKCCYRRNIRGTVASRGERKIDAAGGVGRLAGERK